MNDATDCRQRLKAALEHEIQCTEALIRALDEEQEALTGREPARLETVLRDKQSQLVELEQASRQRNAVVQQAGYSADRQGVEACVRACDVQGSLNALWERLNELVRQCRERNRVNGGIVELSRHHVQRALAVLRGGLPDSDLYTSEGRSVGGASHRSLGKV
jgi:flagella synthesis protein FlgN